jgi:hypothetical protein
MSSSTTKIPLRYTECQVQYAQNSDDFHSQFNNNKSKKLLIKKKESRSQLLTKQKKKESDQHYATINSILIHKQRELAHSKLKTIESQWSTKHPNSLKAAELVDINRKFSNLEPIIQNGCHLTSYFLNDKIDLTKNDVQMNNINPLKQRIAKTDINNEMTSSITSLNRLPLRKEDEKTTRTKKNTASKPFLLSDSVAYCSDSTSASPTFENESNSNQNDTTISSNDSKTKIEINLPSINLDFKGKPKYFNKKRQEHDKKRSSHDDYTFRRHLITNNSYSDSQITNSMYYPAASTTDSLTKSRFEKASNTIKKIDLNLDSLNNFEKKKRTFKEVSRIYQDILYEMAEFRNNYRLKPIKYEGGTIIDTSDDTLTTSSSQTNIDKRMCRQLKQHVEKIKKLEEQEEKQPQQNSTKSTEKLRAIKQKTQTQLKAEEKKPIKEKINPMTQSMVSLVHSLSTSSLSLINKDEKIIQEPETKVESQHFFEANIDDQCYTLDDYEQSRIESPHKLGKSNPNQYKFMTHSTSNLKLNSFQLLPLPTVKSNNNNSNVNNINNANSLRQFNLYQNQLYDKYF